MAAGITKVCSVMTIAAAGLPWRQPCGEGRRKKRRTEGRRNAKGKAKREGSPVTSPTGCGMRRQPYGLRGCAAEWRSGCAAEWRRRAKRRKIFLAGGRETSLPPTPFQFLARLPFFPPTQRTQQDFRSAALPVL